MKDQTSPQAAGTNRGSSSGRTRLRTTAVQVGSECFSSISWRIMFVGLAKSSKTGVAGMAHDNVVENFDFQKLTCANEITGDFNVRLGRSRISARVIVLCGAAIYVQRRN